MKLWRISQIVNNCYDTFDCAVVAATTREEAQKVAPGGEYTRRMDWAPIEDVTVTYIGEAANGFAEGEIIVSSFKAG